MFDLAGYMRHGLTRCQFLHSEKQEKNTALLKNAEISQSEERLKQELRNELHEINEMCETSQKLQMNLESRTEEIKRLQAHIHELDERIAGQNVQIEGANELTKEFNEKNKVCVLACAPVRQFIGTDCLSSLQTIKVLNQRLVDMKKTLQHELKGTLNSSNGNGMMIESSTPVTPAPQPIMDDVNFKYLKHVILKFLTSREVRP